MRYVIGIDLGTTNSCVAYIDTQDPKRGVQLLKIPQIISEGNISSLPTLPSFCYLASDYEWRQGGLSLPWDQSLKSAKDYFVGAFAASQGAKTPTRLVGSAKSWLCHPAASRRDKILPLEASAEGLRISPVEASARYLAHVRAAWNDTLGKGSPEGDFDAQEIVLTVPASFDEVARTLTIEAARKAGFRHMTLLEEPQAAFYSWLASHEKTWESTLKPGDRVLVCDVGGGTTDFSLIDVVESGGAVSLNRRSVGEHLLLGGDNMDAAVAHLIETKLEERGILVNPLQRSQLLHEARRAKEALLSEAEHPDAVYKVILQGYGSGVVQNTVSIDLKGNEVVELLTTGFFGDYEWEEALQMRKTAGFRTMGLPYEDEPSIIKQLANFLSINCGGRDFPPTHLLFNGGAMKPHLFREALLSSLSRWFPQSSVVVLDSYNLDLAVARGAAYYGQVRRGVGVKIGGGLARGYYLVLEVMNGDGTGDKRALCLLPKGSEEGATFEPDKTFTLSANIPVSFQLSTSHTRMDDAAGDLIEIHPEEMHLLPPIQTILWYGKKAQSEVGGEKVAVHIYIKLTPYGTVELGLKSLNTDHRWQLEFQVRTATGQDDSLSLTKSNQSDQIFDQTTISAAEKAVNELFNGKSTAVKPERFMERIEEVVGIARGEWPPSVMRKIADVLIKRSSDRKISPEFEARWWNILGYTMRPGFGYPLDDFRIKEVWKVILGTLKETIPLEVSIQTAICFRRLAGGLNKGQQTQLASHILPQILSKAGRIEIRNKSDLYPISEKIRALGAFELLDTQIKIRIGNAIVERIIAGVASSAEFWALGRIGSRYLLYGTLANVVSAEQCLEWIDRLIAKAPNAKEDALLTLIGQIGRMTEHREINIGSAAVEAITTRFKDHPSIAILEGMLTQPTLPSQAEQMQALGDALPVGLQLQLKVN